MTDETDDEPFGHDVGLHLTDEQVETLRNGETIDFCLDVDDGVSDDDPSFVTVARLSFVEVTVVDDEIPLTEALSDVVGLEERVESDE